MEIPFVDFYNKHNISPVQQNIEDLQKHYNRRESLYQILGIPPLLLNSKNIIEFGPGSGHNAIYTASLNPQSYFLVDGSDVGYNSTKSKFSNYPNIVVNFSLFQDFRLDQKFDLVIAEGCLPHQKDPISLLTHISTFVKENGILLITTANGISYLSETLRRLMSNKLMIDSYRIEDQISKLKPIFQSHLATLKNMSRPIEDWILDSIIQPLNTVKLLSIPEAIGALNKDFEFYNSSPSFRQEWRWYKDINSEKKGFNEAALSEYYKYNLNLLDYRFTVNKQEEEVGFQLENLCSHTWNIMSSLQSKDDNYSWDDLYRNLENIIVTIENKLPTTALAIREILQWFQSSSKEIELERFPSWWGRGSQYVSFMKR